MKKSAVKPKSTVTTKAKPAPKASPSQKSSTNGLASKPRVSSGDGSRLVQKGPSADAEEILESLEETYRQQCEELAMAGVDPTPVRISLRLIARRNLTPNVALGSHEKLIKALSNITHLRLDRENIGHIDDLEMMGPVTNLYLQQNMIKRIENLESLQSLRFLTLANNQIERVENLHNLPALRLLDLSFNQVQELSSEELPKSLLILNMEGNPCCQQPDYRKKILLSLPNLGQLDNHEVTMKQRLEAGCDVHFSSDEDEDDGDGDEDGEIEHSTDGLTDKDVLQLSTDMIKKCRLRSQQQNDQHYQHMEELVHVRSQSQLAMNTARSGVMTSSLES